MVEISYSLSSSWAKESTQLDIANADEMTLRYNAFYGNIIFRIGETNFSAIWGWIPVLDFATCLLGVVRRFAAGEEKCVVDFTESDAELIFKRDNGLISISATYNNHQAQVYLDELANAVNEFARRMYSDIVSLHPEAKRNQIIRKLLLQ